MMYLMPPGGVLPGKFFSKSVYLTISLSLSLDRLRPTNFCLHHQSRTQSCPLIVCHSPVEPSLMTLLLLEGLSGKFFPSVALDCLRPSNFCLHHQSLNAASTVSPSITQSRSPDRLRCLTGPSVALMLTGGAIRRCCCPPGVNSATRLAARRCHFPSVGAAHRCHSLAGQPVATTVQRCGPVLSASRGTLLSTAPCYQCLCLAASRPVPDELTAACQRRKSTSSLAPDFNPRPLRYGRPFFPIVKIFLF